MENMPPHSAALRKYNWEEWADGQARELVAGVHFEVSSVKFVKAAHRYAERHNLRAITRRVADFVYLQLVTREPAGRAPRRP